MNLLNKNYLRSIIFGGVDGIITIFNIISGVEGAKMKYPVVLVIGSAALVSDAVSMGFSDYLSIHADRKIKHKHDIKIDSKIDPVKSGLITFGAFIAFGLIPLLTYLFYSNYKNNNHYIKTSISTIVSFSKNIDK